MANRAPPTFRARHPDEDAEEVYNPSPYPPMNPPYMAYDPTQSATPYGLPPPPPLEVGGMRRSGSNSPQLMTHADGSMSPWAALNKRQSRRVSQMPPHSALSKRDAPLYEDLINFPRAKDKDEMRCVMCGMPPGGAIVIPRQNKDVCKDCDKATWHHTATGVYFKWCKGCKKFLKLGAFSQKLDAAKCDKCRERGRQSYLMKKGRDGEDMTTARHPPAQHYQPMYGAPVGLPPQPPPQPAIPGVSRQTLLHRRARPHTFRHHADGSDYSGEEEPNEEEEDDEEAARQGMMTAEGQMGHLPPHMQMPPHVMHGHPGMPPHMQHMGAPHGHGHGEEEELDDEAADQALTQMRLSTNFGVPLSHLQGAHNNGEQPPLGISTPPNGPVSTYTAESMVPPPIPNGVGASAGGASGAVSGGTTVVTDHDNLRKLARIQEEVRQLEAQAAQVMVISNKLSEEAMQRRKADARVQALERENQHLRAEIERLHAELAYWQQQTNHTDEGGMYDAEGGHPYHPTDRPEAAISTYDPTGGEKRGRSDSINGAAALLGGIKKQRTGGGGYAYEPEEKIVPPVAAASSMMPFPQSTYDGQASAQQQPPQAVSAEPMGSLSQALPPIPQPEQQQEEDVDVKGHVSL